MTIKTDLGYIDITNVNSSKMKYKNKPFIFEIILLTVRK